MPTKQHPERYTESRQRASKRLQRKRKIESRALELVKEFAPVIYEEAMKQAELEFGG